MNNDKSKQSAKLKLPTRLEYGAMDTAGMWFSAVVLLAVLAAGIIIYRAANDEIGIASNNTISAPAPHLR